MQIISLRANAVQSNDKTKKYPQQLSLLLLQFTEYMWIVRAADTSRRQNIPLRLCHINKRKYKIYIYQTIVYLYVSGK